MGKDTKLTLELDQLDCATLQSVIGLAVEHGDPIQAQAAATFGNKFTAAMVAQNPELREQVGEVLETAREQGAPEDVVDELRELFEAPPISEDEIAEAKVEDILDRIQREGDDGEEEAA